jgi:hypothetical protein
MRPRRAPTADPQSWADPLDVQVDPDDTDKPGLDALVEALGLAVARREDRSRRSSEH